MSQAAPSSMLKAALVALAVLAGSQAPSPLLGEPVQKAVPDAAAFLISPRTIAPGETVRILAASETVPEPARLDVRGPSGTVSLSRPRNGGGPPRWWSAEFKPEVEGVYTIALSIRTEVLARVAARVGSPGLRGEAGPQETPGPVMSWNRAAENLYSAWVESLFYGADEQSSWRALQEVTQDEGSNVLYNFLGLAEDSPSSRGGVVMKPDCADAPYFLRAYFAWKLGLPFGFRKCTRGSLRHAPQCADWAGTDFAAGQSGTQAFNRFLAGIMDAVHSGTARTRLEDEHSDYYPVPLTRESLRPGVVFADPYGHTLVITRWTPQTPEKPGRLLAVDAQPDGTIGLRRFWRGNFLFNTRDVIGEPGFKAFRPVRREGGGLHPLTNAEVRDSPDYGRLSLVQKNMPVEAFYDTMERLINPQPLKPAAALRDLFDGFYEQLQTRVISVANAEDYMTAHPGAVVPMPSTDTAVFQTLGEWEDYSTPNRDMRLLIAMDALLDFPDRVKRSPKFYSLPPDQTADTVKQEMDGLLTRWSRETTITYTKSNGTPRTLTVEEILRRAMAFEAAYNPNDCVEIRWGAPEGSEERAACIRRAPPEQRRRMESLRSWFRRRLRPPT